MTALLLLLLPAPLALLAWQEHVARRRARRRAWQREVDEMMRVIRPALEHLAASIGQQMIPAMTAMVPAVNRCAAAFRQFGEALSQRPPPP